MKRNRVWLIALFLAGIVGIIIIGKRELVNGYFSTVKLRFLTNFMESNYLYEMDAETGYEGIYEGYLEGVENSVTYYLSKEDLKAEKIAAQGDYFGTGLKLTWNLDGHSFTVVSVLEGSSAEKASLQQGDKITKIAGIPVLPANRQTLIEQIVSNAEEEVTYEVERDGENFIVRLCPTQVTLEALSAQMLDDVLYVKVHAIKEETSLALKQLIDETDFSICKGIILDIRGLLTYQMEEIAQISDLFLSEGIAFKVQSRSDGVVAYEMTEAAYDIPLVVLANHETLAGGEALLLALKERATVVGSDTGGLYYIQHIVDFEDGSGMSVAAGKICDRYGNVLEKEGVMPEIRLYLDEEEQMILLERGYLTEEEDIYLQHALTLF